MKPAEFFIGIVDLFAVLLPGGLAAGALLHLFLAPGYLECLRKLPLVTLLPSGVFWPYWVAFALASYLFGHFIFLIGSVSLDNLYDETYRKWRRGEDHAIQARAKGLLQAAPIGLALPEIDSTLQWSAIYARLRSPAQALEIDRLEADSKFFRSLAVLLLIGDALVPVFGRPGILRWAEMAFLCVAFAATAAIGGWKRKDERIRQRAYRRSLSHAERDPAAPQLAAVEHWLAAERDVRLQDRLALILAVAAVVSIHLPYLNSASQFAWHAAGFLCLALSLWRFMERRYKRTVLTYRLFIASVTVPAAAGVASPPKAGSLTSDP